MNKSLIIILDETKTEMISVINNAIQNGAPCYLLEPIMSELLAQIRDGAKNELRMAREQMNNTEQEEE